MESPYNCGKSQLCIPPTCYNVEGDITDNNYTLQIQVAI